METASNNQDSCYSNPNRAFKSLEEELSFKINDLRFHSREFMKNTASHILSNNDPETLTISFPDLSRKVYYVSPQNLTNFTQFLQQNMSTNQIFQDFTFPPNLNEHFINGFGKTITQEKSLGLSSEGNMKLRLEIPSKLYYGYYLESVPINKMESLLGFIIFEEYISLTNGIVSGQAFNIKDNFVFEYNDSKPIEYIPFLSNIYNTILIHSEKIDENLYNLYFLLLSETVDEDNNESGKQTKNRALNVGELAKGDKRRKSTHYSAVGNVTQPNQLIPQKYRSLWFTHRQIPRKSLEKLVKEMDSNNDLKVTLQDIINYSHRKYIHLNREVYEGMFKEAAKNRPVLFPKEKAIETFDTMPPLSIEEIQKALAIHLRKDGSKQKEVFKPYFDVWLMFMSENGDPNLKTMSIPHEIPKPIMDQHDEMRLTRSTFKPSQTLRSTDPLTKSSGFIQNIKPKSYLAPYRPEANIIINNTENIQEVVVEREFDEKPKNSDQFAKTINGQFVESIERNNDFKSITFYTQKYYQEALRLSKKPDLYTKQEKNPIVTYIPENFDFKINKENQNNQRPFFNKKSSVISAISPPTVSYISDKKEIPEFENQEIDFPDNFTTLNNINPIVPPIKPIYADLQRAQTTEESRKKSLRPNRLRQNEDRSAQRLFHASFKPQDCETLKRKLARLEPVVDRYVPPSAHQFRDDVPTGKNVLFKTRFKPESLENPYNMSQHDLRPKEVLDKEEKEKLKREREQEETMNRYLGQFVADKQWIKYFRRADLERKEGFIDHKHPEFIFVKGHYSEPTQIMNNLLRGEALYEKNFRLFHRSLRSDDKNRFFGQNKGSLF